MLRSSNIRVSMKKSRRRSAPSYEDIYMKDDELPKSLREILDSKVLRAEFMAFLRTRASQDSLLFFEAIELYERLASPEHRQRAGRRIVQDFVIENSAYWVNLPGTISNTLQETTEFTEESFEKARREIFSLLSINYFVPFCKHLTGASGYESTPRLSIENSERVSFSRSASFEQLSEALGDSCRMTLEEDERLECKCKKGDKVCCQTKKAKLRVEMMKYGSLQSSASLRLVAPRKTTLVEGNVSQVSKKSKTKSRFFGSSKKKHHTSARSMSFWQDIDMVL